MRTRRGVEAFVEPATSVTAADRPAGRVHGGVDPAAASPTRTWCAVLAEDLAVPVYDVQLVGYPQRMRDWNERAKRAGERSRTAAARQGG